MAETPDEILRALADPERLSIAGRLVGVEATAQDLAEALDERFLDRDRGEYWRSGGRVTT